MKKSKDMSQKNNNNSWVHVREGEKEYWIRDYSKLTDSEKKRIFDLSQSQTKNNKSSENIKSNKKKKSVNNEGKIQKPPEDLIDLFNHKITVSIGRLIVIFVIIGIIILIIYKIFGCVHDDQDTNEIYTFGEKYKGLEKSYHTSVLSTMEKIDSYNAKGDYEKSTLLYVELEYVIGIFSNQLENIYVPTPLYKFYGLKREELLNRQIFAHLAYLMLKEQEKVGESGIWYMEYNCDAYMERADKLKDEADLAWDEVFGTNY